MHERLEEVRKNHGLSKKDFAKKIEITEQAYQNYSNGKRLIPTETALRIKHMFNISLDWLLYGDSNFNINFIEENKKIIEKLTDKEQEKLYHLLKTNFEN